MEQLSLGHIDLPMRTHTFYSGIGQRETQVTSVSLRSQLLSDTVLSRGTERD